MKTGIIVAMESELSMLLPLIENMTRTTVNGFVISHGRMGANEVAVMQTGIGKVNAAVGAISLIDSFNPDLVVNTGIAGGTGRGADILDVVIADSVAYHDVYCGPGNERGQVQGLPAEFPCLGVSMVNLEAVAGRDDIRRGLIASGDIFVTTPQDLAGVLDVQPRAIAVDMESGAIAQVCHMRGVPFLAIRVVSDTPGVEHHCEQYSEFFTLAPRSTFGVVKALLS
ncbi:MAG: 5'-methylthioadenosine/adenosylhomocysteine nucleosidase [Muribaculaceae bacterium]|nr:5'-methylthioadenosine/adenosylhomocysteine nucleosidase [Muribaculaceae bacterium]